MPRRSPDPLDSMPDLADDGAMAAKRGRPAKAAEERRSEALNLRMTSEEKAFIIAAADRVGLATSVFVLDAVRAFSGEAPTPRAIPAAKTVPLSKQLREVAEKVAKLEKEGAI